MTDSIPFVDFGGAGEVLHFAHPNAYTPETFHRFLDPLTAHFHVLGIKQRPLWPNSDPAELSDWTVFADDLIRFFDENDLRGVIGVGHSLGAVATMYAAVQRPDLFSKLILIEPVFMPPQVLQMIAALSAAEMRQHPLVQSALYRRSQWSTRQEAFDRFRPKPVFARFSDELLWDYVNYSLTENEDGTVSLLFPSAWEAQIYANFPMQVWAELPKVTHPILGIRGAESDTLMPEAWAYWQELQPGGTYVEISDTGHMLTLERPYAVSEAILNHLISEQK